jgi:hypothetical protein
VGVTLVVAGAAAWALSSPLWPGAAFQPRNYEIVPHDRLVRHALSDVDPAAVVAAQDALVPHLSHRKEIYLFPWIYAGADADVVALDRSMGTYPLSLGEYTSRFYDYLASPEYEIAHQVDDFFLFQRTDSVVSEISRDDVWGGLIRLTGVTVDAAEDGTSFEVTTTASDVTTLRVVLMWQMVAATDRNYTVFVHAIGDQGQLLTQHDTWPADEHRPTSVLSPGSVIRDVHFLRWAGRPEAAQSLRVGVYHSLTGEELHLPDGAAFITLPGP